MAELGQAVQKVRRHPRNPARIGRREANPRYVQWLARHRPHATTRPSSNRWAAGRENLTGPASPRTAQIRAAQGRSNLPRYGLGSPAARRIVRPPGVFEMASARAEGPHEERNDRGEANKVKEDRDQSEARPPPAPARARVRPARV